MKLHFTASLLGLTLLMLPALAHADVNDIRASDKAIEADYGTSFLKYGETVDKTTFDTEKGWISAGEVGLQWLVSSPSSAFNDMYAALDAQYNFGSDDYDGGIQSCSGSTCTVTPFNSTTYNNVLQIDGKLGKLFAANSWLAITPYADLGFRYWKRDINGRGIVAGNVEKYEAGSLMAGIMVQASPVSHLVLTATAAGGGTLSPTMNTMGNTYQLGSSSTYQLTGKVGYTFTPSMELIGKVRFDGLGFGASQLVGGSSYEPDSYTHQLSIMGGLAYHL